MKISFNVNSADRRDPNITTSSDFIISILNPLNVRILSYTLHSAIIPKTYYNILSTTFNIIDSSGPKVIAIPGGVYDIDSLITTLDLALTGPDNYVITKSNTTMRLSIQSDFTGFEINPTGLANDFLVQLGFLNETPYVSTLGLIEAPNVIDISGIKKCFVKISPFPEFGQDTRSLKCNFYVPMMCSYGSFVYYTNPRQEYSLLPFYVSRISEFAIQLVDEKNQLVDLNGADWSMVMQFEYEDLD